MSISDHATDDAERERLQLTRELETESGPAWADDYRCGSFGCHELLDRTAMMADMLEHHLLKHPACVANPAWYALVDQATVALRELYQQIGAEHL